MSVLYAPPYWLVWCEDGDAPRVKHPSVDAASREAERLARAYPGKSFCVLAPVARVTRTDLRIERFDQVVDVITDDMVPF